MERGERFYFIHRQMQGGRCLPGRHFQDALEVSRATFNRDIEYMRDRLGAPIVYDRDRRGYRYAASEGDPRFELPGLWFNARELHAFLSIHALLDDMADGILGEQLDIVRDKLHEMIGDQGLAPDELRRRVRIFRTGMRSPRGEAFPVLAQALVQRRQVEIEYQARTTADHTTRCISPQRLIHYRGNWYCDAWCHLRNGLRNFSVDAMLRARQLDLPALEVADEQLEQEIGAAYGIFSGPARFRAELIFSAERSRWIRDEVWHPDQQGEVEADGRYRLSVPYAAEHELLMDLLRHAGHVEVLAPTALRTQLRTLAESLLRQNPERDPAG